MAEHRTKLATALAAPRSAAPDAINRRRHRVWVAIALVLTFVAVFRCPSGGHASPVDTSVAGVAANSPNGRDQAAVRRLMAAAERHQQQQRPEAGLLARGGDGAYEFYRPDPPLAKTKKSQQQQQSQWRSLNGAWGKRDGGNGEQLDDAGDEEEQEAGDLNDWTGDEMVFDETDGEDESPMVFVDGSDKDELELSKRSWKSLNGAWGKRGEYI